MKRIKMPPPSPSWALQTYAGKVPKCVKLQSCF
jgi:hypothetical protein